MSRWTKDVVPNELSRVFDVEEFGYCKNEQAKKIAREILSYGEYLVNNLITEIDDLSIVRDEMKELTKKVDEKRFSRPSMSKYDRFSSIMGYEPNLEATVRLPTGIRNKGRGSHKRFKSKKEKAISLAGKRSRTCLICGVKGHDRRTCRRRTQGTKNTK